MPKNLSIINEQEPSSHKMPSYRANPLLLSVESMEHMISECGISLSRRYKVNIDASDNLIRFDPYQLIYKDVQRIVICLFLH